MVFNNGPGHQGDLDQKSEYAQTLPDVRERPNKGQPVPMVRGQIFIQCVPTYVPARWTVGSTPAPEIGTQGS